MEIRNLPRPSTAFTFQWHITERCNWNCKHCYQSGEYLNNELDIESLLYILKQYVDILKLWNIRGTLNITGGEPFIRKDFFQLLEEISKNQSLIEYNILTNGSLITEKIAKRLKELQVSQIQVSLEGMKKTNDEIRGDGSFEKIIRAIKILLEENIYTIVSFSSNRKNYKEFGELVELAKGLGVNAVWTDRLVPYGHGKQMEKEMLEPLEVKEFYESIHKISKKALEEKSKTKILTERTLYFLPLENANNDLYDICSAGEKLLAVMPNGDVLPCRRMPIIVGNLMKESLLEIFYKNEELWKLRDINEINVTCRQCENFNRCMGGARCISYSYFNTLFTPDPQCWKLFNKLPSSEKLKSFHPENNKFLPKPMLIYSKLMGAYPYIRLEENSISYVSEKNSIVLSQDSYLKMNIEDIKSESEKIIKRSPEFIIISFQFSEKNLNNDSGPKIIDFMSKLKDNNVNFKIAKPLPRCIFGFDYHDVTSKFDIPKSCKDCLELFRINANNEIELCLGKIGPKLKYMNDRNQIYEYFELLHKSTRLDGKCGRCLWFLRRQCNGLCQ